MEESLEEARWYMRCFDGMCVGSGGAKEEECGRGSGIGGQERGREGSRSGGDGGGVN